MDAPIGILHEEVLNVTELAVTRMDVLPGDRFDAAQMRIVVASPSIGNIGLHAAWIPGKATAIRRRAYSRSRRYKSRYPQYGLQP